MKFIIQSSELNKVLQSAGKIINLKHPMPIMEYFLFELQGGVLSVTASDQETTQVTKIAVSEMEKAGEVAVPSRLMLEVLKEFADQPISVTVDAESLTITIEWSSGSIAIPGQQAASYPALTTLSETDTKKINVDASIVEEMIGLTIFATADKSSRPTMTGILFDISADTLTAVGTDGHKLVRVLIPDVKNEVPEPTSFILPRRPAAHLRQLLGSTQDVVKIEFDDKNIHFSFGDTIFISRMIEGRFPNYNSVIPQGNSNTVIIDRQEFLSAIRRVSVCSDKSSNMVNFAIEGNSIKLQAKDVNFYVSAEDSLNCNHAGENITIGFKYTTLIELLTTFTSQSIELALNSSTTPGLFMPIETNSLCEQNTVVLMMPIV